MASLAGNRIFGIKAHAVVLDRKLDGLWFVAQLQANDFALRVPNGVGRGFLADTQKVAFNPARQLTKRSENLEARK